MSIYSFLLHVAAVILSAFHLAPEATVRVATHTSPHRPIVQAATRVPDSGFWHTSGNLILDRQNRQVRIQGINWYGFETVRQVPGGLTRQDYRSILETIRNNGFNTVRIPLSNQMVESPIVPEAISFSNDRGAINANLRGLNSLQVLDRIIEAAGDLGLKVILDNHRSEAGDSAEASGLWYTDEYPEASWIADWQRLAARYSNNSTVIGVDLRNEPHNANAGGACWDCGGERDWHLAAQRAGNAVLQTNPQLLIFVEGVDACNGDYFWWGGNLQGVRRSPVRLQLPGQLVYSAHSYGPNEYRQKWFNESSTLASLEAVEYRHWAFISLQGIAPVWLGEFGTTNRTEDIRGMEPGSEGLWFQSMVDLLGRNPELNWSSWALNGEDAYGLLDANYNLAPANPMKMELLARIESPALPGISPQPQTIMAGATIPATPQYAASAARPALQRVSYEVPGRANAGGEGTAACHVVYSNRNDTGYGATGVIEIENLSSQNINGWTLLWMYNGGQQIETARNARFVQRDDMVMMTNTQANGAIPAGRTLSGIMLQTSYRGRNVRPAKFYLNGNLCS